MYAGKSTKLLQLINEHSEKGRKCLLVNHSFDTRCPGVGTHDGEREPSLKLNLLEEVYTHLDGVEVVGIDECQFFKDLDTVVLDLVRKNIIVVCAGLTGDYKRDLFGKTHILIPHADDLIFSVAYCSICKNGNKAQFTKRIKNYEGVIDIGATDKYMAVCRKHYL
jgi:thymidine kinase